MIEPKTSHATGDARKSVAIVGGGLAGMAAAAALVDEGVDIELFEARRTLAGRASSFRDAATCETVDFCQHVSMGCCVNLADFCRRTGVDGHFRRERALHFFGPDGRRFDFAASRWLPAPIHLGPSFLRLGYLSLADRLRVARGLWRLARASEAELARVSMAEWLASAAQSRAAVDRFWSVVITSALGESVEHAAASAARKVFVDGFMANKAAYEVLVPQLPLSRVFGEQAAGWLERRGVRVWRETSARRIALDGDRARGIVFDDCGERGFDAVVAAVPWRRIGDLFTPDEAARLDFVRAANELRSSPITGVHLWFDRAITPLPHAVLVGTLAQWLFARGESSTEGGEKGHYYQVVISASRDLAGHDRDAIVKRLHEELAVCFPAARGAKLTRARIVTDQQAVFSARHETEPRRPPQRTAIANLALAGDWTQTGWPSTMEGAVRSGYLAAEVVLNDLGRASRKLVDDLPKNWLVRRMERRR